MHQLLRRALGGLNNMSVLEEPFQQRVALKEVFRDL